MVRGMQGDERPTGWQRPTFEPGSLPRSYGARWRYKVYCALLLAAGVAVAVTTVYWAGAPVLLVALPSLVAALRRQIVLRPDAIEIQGLWRRRIVPVQQIKGVRLARLARTAFLSRYGVIERIDGSPLRLDSEWKRDEVFDAWIAHLPDLNAADQLILQQAISSDPTWGGTVDGRWQNFQLWRAATRVVVPVLCVLVIASIHWRIDRPQLQDAVALLPLALLAAVAISAGRLRLVESRGDVQPGVFTLMLLACIVTVMRQFDGAPIERWANVLPAAIVVGGLLGGWGWRLSAMPLLPSAYRWPIFPLMFIYAGAGLAMLNMRLDRADVVATEQVVVDRKRHDNHFDLSLHLDLIPTDVRSDRRSLAVTLATYNNVSPGETVCLLHHPGRFGWPWLNVQPCSSAAPTASGLVPDALHRALALAAYSPERRGPLLQLLYAAQYDELDSRLEALQRRFEHHDVSSMDLLVAYRDFYDPNPALDPLFDQWVTGHPQSYGARLARGIHRKFQAATLHGAGFEKWLSPQANVEPVLDRQIDDLEQSIPLTAQPILSYVHLMDAANERRDRQRMRTLLDRGLAVEPGSMALTRKYMALLGRPAPRDEFLAECRAAQMPAATLNTLEAMVLTRRAQNRRVDDKDEDGALALARQAIALDPFADDLSMALYEAAWILGKRGEHQAAVDLLERAVRATPDEGSVHAQMATSLWQLDRREESLQQVRAAAQLGWAPSQAYLGESLLKGQGMPKDEAEGREWLGKAAAAGNERALKLLRDNPSPP